MRHNQLKYPEQSSVSNSFRFATNVWLTSVLLSPFLFFLLSGTIDTKKLHIEAAGLQLFITFALFFGLLFSLPCWTIFVFTTKFINKQSISLVKKKAFISVTGVVLTYLLFYLLFFRDKIEQQLDFNLKLATAYCLTILGGIAFYKLNPDRHIVEGEEDSR